MESFAYVIQQLLPLAQEGSGSSNSSRQPPHIVEFGAGSGNLVLPLAWAMPWAHFHAIDYKRVRGWDAWWAPCCLFSDVQDSRVQVPMHLSQPAPSSERHGAAGRL